jgi:hypothetical protein
LSPAADLLARLVEATEKRRGYDRDHAHEKDTPRDEARQHETRVLREARAFLADR